MIINKIKANLDFSKNKARSDLKFDFPLNSILYIFVLFFRIHNGYNSLPRSASAREGFYNSNSCNSVASASVVPRSRSSASIGDHHSTPKPSRPSSAASNGPKGGHQRPKSRLGSSQHASLSIAQIQRELKRGEMVQVIVLFIFFIFIFSWKRKVEKVIVIDWLMRIFFGWPSSKSLSLKHSRKIPCCYKLFY